MTAGRVSEGSGELRHHQEREPVKSLSWSQSETCWKPQAVQPGGAGGAESMERLGHLRKRGAREEELSLPKASRRFLGGKAETGKRALGWSCVRAAENS